MLAAALAGVGPAWGCGGASAPMPPAAAAPRPAEDEASAGLVEHHRFHHHGGVTLFIAMSLDTLGVSPEQRDAVASIRSELNARLEGARAAEQDLVAVLADGLAAGAIDEAKVDAADARLTSVASTAYDACADAINKLHAVLQAPQRAALVDKIESHWAVWRAANGEEPTGPPPEAGGGRLATLASDLALAPDQVERIRGRLAEAKTGGPRFDSREVTTQVDAFGAAFRGETFDARALTAARNADSNLVDWGSFQLVRLVEAACPVLTQEQRTELGQELREHAAHDPSAQANP